MSLTPLAKPKTLHVFEGRVARVHRAGDGLRYRRDGKWFEELRDEVELENVVAQLAGRPVVLFHPDGSPENAEGIIADGARAHIVGHIRAARLDGEWAVTEFEVDDDGADAIRKRGIRQLSLGYLAVLDKDRHQRGTIVDHLALEMRARCGDGCAVRVDGADQEARFVAEDGAEVFLDEPATEVEPAPRTDNSCGCSRAAQVANEASCDQMGSICNCRAVPYAAQEMADHDDLQKKLDAALAEVETHKARAAQAETERDEHKVRADKAEIEAHNARSDAKKAETERDEHKVRADKAETDATAASERVRMDAEAAIDARVQQRVELLSIASPIIGKDEKGGVVDLTKLSDRAIKAAVVKRVDGEDLDEKRSDDFVEGVFLGAVKRFDSAAISRSEVRAAINTMRQDAADEAKTDAKTGLAAEKAAREARAKNLGAAWNRSN